MSESLKLAAWGQYICESASVYFCVGMFVDDTELVESSIFQALVTVFIWV